MPIPGLKSAIAGLSVKIHGTWFDIGRRTGREVSPFSDPNGDFPIRS